MPNNDPSRKTKHINILSLCLLMLVTNVQLSTCTPSPLDNCKADAFHLWNMQSPDDSFENEAYWDAIEECEKEYG